MTTTQAYPYELRHVGRSVIVDLRDGVFYVDCLLRGSVCADAKTLNEEHADYIASSWLLHGIAPRSAQTLRGMPACVLP
jgi:hypothetical protein